MPSPPRQETPSPGTRAQWARPIGLVLAGSVLIFAAALGTAALTLQHSLAPEPFAAHLSRGLGRTITVESVALSLTPLPTVRLEGVVFEGLGTAGAAEVAVRTRPLLRRKIVARSVVFEDLHVTLHRRDDGSFEPLVAARPGGAPFDWQAFPRFDAQRGEIRIVQGENVSAVIGVRALSLSKFDGDGRAQLVLAGSIGGEDRGWSIQPLQLRGRLVRHPGRFAFEEARLNAERAHVGWWNGRRVRGRFVYDHGRVDVAELTVDGFSGRWRADGVIHLRGGTRLDLAVDLADVRVAELFAAARPQDALADLGLLQTSWHLKIPWDRGPRFEHGIGRGELTIRGGTLPTTSLRAQLSDVFGLSEGQRRTTPVESLHAPVSLGDGRVYSEKARLVTADYTLDATGSVGLDRTLALEGELHMAGLPTLPVTIGGALPHPELDTHASRIPKNGFGAMAKAVGNAGRRLRGALFGGSEEAPTAQ